MSSSISNEEEPYPFVRQVDSEREVNEVQQPGKGHDVVPFKKTITAGEAMARLNTILDVQAKLQAFQLPNDRPVARSEPLSGSVRLSQLVSLERELKAAIYFRSQESPWTDDVRHVKRLTHEDLMKMADEFHKKLTREHETEFLESHASIVSGQIKNYSRNVEFDEDKKNKIWPWPLPGKAGRKMWEPLPDTVVKQWEPWTTLREKPTSKSRRKIKAPPKKNPLDFVKPQVPKPPRKLPIKQPEAKAWDPATHMRRTQIISKLATPKNLISGTPKSTRFQDSLKKLKVPEYQPPQGTSFPKILSSQETTKFTIKTKRPSFRSGYFRMPPLKIMSKSEPDHPKQPSRDLTLEVSTIFTRKKNRSNAIPKIDSKQGPNIPGSYPLPWQLFKYPSLEDKKRILNLSGSISEELTKKEEVKLGAPNSMSVLARNRRSQQLISYVSTETLSIEPNHHKSKLPQKFSRAKGRGTTAGTLIDSIAPVVGSLPYTPGRPDSPSFPSTSVRMATPVKAPTYYIDRGLESALAEVQKAIKTALPTFKLDKSQKPPTETEIKADDFLKKFIDTMTHTVPQNSYFVKPREEERKMAPMLPQRPPRTRPAKIQKMVQNVGNPVMVLVVNGKPQIPEIIFGTHINSFLFAPRTLDFPNRAHQRLTRCTICRPFGLDGLPDPTPNPRNFCQNIPLPGFRDFQISFKFDASERKLIVNGLRRAKGEECYRNVTHAITIPEGMNVKDLEIYRSDKGTLFFHDAREERQIQRREELINEFIFPISSPETTRYQDGDEVEMVFYRNSDENNDGNDYWNY